MEGSMSKTYFQLRSRFGVRKISDTEKLSELILQLKKIEVPYSVYKSNNIRGPWERVEGVYDASTE